MAEYKTEKAKAEAEPENIGEQPVFCAHTLGIQEIRLNGKLLDMKIVTRGKTMQLFLMLLCAGEEGISRIRLQDSLYDRHTTNAENALRICASRLRGLLKDSSLPDVKYVIIKNSTYYLMEYPNHNYVDCIELEKNYQEARAEKNEYRKLQLLENACQLYKGEYLPPLSGELWVEMQRSKYQEIYRNSVQEACQIMKKGREYEKILNLCSRALEICPAEEWVELKIDCLMELKLYKEAMKVYDEAAEKLFKAHGLIPSKTLLVRFKNISEQIQHTSGNLLDIKNSLEEEHWASGAYYCTYPGFVDCFRMGVRNAERGNQTGYLMVCTVLDGKGRHIDDTAKRQLYIEWLLEVIQQSLRRGDIYTKYSQDQVLILANDLKKTRVALLVSRIIQKFREKCGTKAELQIEDVALEEWRSKKAEDSALSSSEPVKEPISSPFPHSAVTKRLQTAKKPKYS